MKYLFLFLISLPSFACLNKISPSDLDKVLAANDPSLAETLTYKGADAICFDGINLREAELVDNMVLDFIRKEKAESCLDEADCIAKEAALICDLGKPIRTENEVYCAVEAYKKDGVKLVVSEAKKAAREKKEKDDETAAKAKEEKCKTFSFKGTNMAALRAELNEWKECKK
jgi:hypothetical protein